MARSTSHLLGTANPVLDLLHKATKREDYYFRKRQVDVEEYSCVAIRIRRTLPMITLNVDLAAF